MIKSSFKGIVLCTLLGNIILTVSAAVDPLQSAIDDILRPPTVSKSTLPDGSVVTTVAISGANPTQGGTIVSPTGQVLQFMTQPDISTTITPRIDAIVSNTTHPSNTIIDYAGNPIRSLLQSNPISTVDIWAGARSQAQSYTTVLTNQRNQSVFIPCSTAHPCSSAMILTATNNTAFDLGSLTILPAISSVLTSGPVSPIQSDSIREARPPVLDTTPAGFTRIYTSEVVPGASCVCIKGTSTDGKIEYDPTGRACGGSVTNRKYECTVPTGLAGFQSVFAKLIRFVINIVLLLGVLSVVGLGIAWSFAGGDDIKIKSNLKKWAINIIIGLAILFFFRYILLFLAPWVYQ